jgi:ribosomal protein S18 acetylase RimI-like enzyme
MTIAIRNLADDDLEEIDEILKLAFQSTVSRLQDLRFYRQIEPDGWFVAIKDGHPAGMVGAINYGAFAHIGFMVVHPNAQRQGIGIALMRYLLARLEQQQVPAAWLDASDMGRPLYEKLGFVTYGATTTFQCRNYVTDNEFRTSNIQPITPDDLEELVQLDTALFGAERRKLFQVLLNLYPGRAFMHRDAQGQMTGYIFAQENRIGPWAMMQSDSAEALLQAALSLPYKDTVSVYVPAENREALELVQRYGFEQLRVSQHMGLHAECIPGQRRKIFAQTSLAAG